MNDWLTTGRRHVIAMVALLLCGCLARDSDTVILDPPGTRLATTVTRGLFLTTVRIGDRQAGPFLIDTGSRVLAFDSRLAKTLPLTIHSRRYDPVYNQVVYFTAVSELAVGAITLRNPSVVIMDLSRVTDGLGQSLAGVLGSPFFENAVVEVDYARQSMSCFDPARYDLRRGAWQPLVLRGQRPGASVRMEGGTEGLFLLDTGSASTAILFPHFVKSHPQVRIFNVRLDRALGVEGERDSFMGQIMWFELSGHRFQYPWVYFEKSEGPTPPEARDFDGLVGEGFLRQFVIVFNYPARKISFLPREPR